MIFNLIKRPKVKTGEPYEQTGLIIKRVPNGKGDPGMRVRIEMGNKTFVSLSNAMHIGRAAQLANHERDPENQFKFNSRVNKQINLLRGLATNLVREYREKKLGTNHTNS